MSKNIYPRLGEVHNIMEILEDGQIVQLNDLSKWRIRSGDISKTVIWYPTQRIIVEENESDIYPYRLKNLDTFQEEEVEATKE
jgi:hypothetical protein